MDYFNASRDASKLERALLSLQWQLLTDAGYQPQLEHDVHTGKALTDEPTYQFDPIAGGLCNTSSSCTWGVRKQTIALLRLVSEDGVFGIEGVDRANKLLCSYVRAILDKQLATMGYVLG